MDDTQQRPDFLPPGFGTVGYQKFVEIRVPAEVPYTPQTAGWWVLAGLVLVGTVLGLWRAVRRYRANAYRRAALAELRALRREAAGAGRADAVTRVPGLLKRCAVAAFGRDDVASLSGETWLAFLERTAPGAIDTQSKQSLRALVVCDASDVAAEGDPALFAGAERWLRRHRA